MQRILSNVSDRFFNLKAFINFKRIFFFQDVLKKSFSCVGISESNISVGNCQDSSNGNESEVCTS